MAISRMQTPRQLYGLGSFVKKLTRKVTRPITKVAKKLVPKEIAGIMRAAAPFLPTGYREAAYLLGTAKQTGRISPMDLALTAAPTFFGRTTTGQNLAKRIGDFKLPGMERDLRTIAVGGKQDAVIGRLDADSKLGPLVGSDVKSAMSAQIRPPMDTQGFFGKGGDFNVLKGSMLADPSGKIKLGTAAALGTGVLSLISSAKTPQEAGENLVAQTGNSDDYERGANLFAQLKPELFEVPEQFRMPVKDGGRIGFREGTARRGLGGLGSIGGPKSDFFKDLFLNRAGGGGKDYIMPMEASERTFNEIFTIGGDDIRKAKEIEAERILPSLYNQAMTVIDAIQDIDDEETKMKMLRDVNTSFDRTEGFGLAKAANSYYNIIQKYGYLLDKPAGLGSMMPRNEQADGGLMRTNFSMGSKDVSDRAQQYLDYVKEMEEMGVEPMSVEDFNKLLDSMKDNMAAGGLMRTNFAIGSDDPKPLPSDPTEPVNPFRPKPIGPFPSKRASVDDPFYRDSEADRDEHSFRMFNKPYKELNEFELEEFQEEMMRLMNKFSKSKNIMMAGSDRYQRILEEIINEMEDALGRELTNEEYDLAGQLAYDKLNSPPGSMDYAKGGRVNYALGTRPTAQESGLGGLPIEADMRYTGGFMPYGAKEKADDVPARLSKNEFVFTADAVRAAGGGSVQKGAQKMYNTMKQLEAKPEAKGMMA